MVPAMPTRAEMWERVAGDGAEVDLLVVGGGITGAGVARDAARRGLSVALVEMRDLASGTSSRSSKLVHGGLRYLEQFELGLVFEAVAERGVLSRIAPHLVTPLPFLFPIYESSRVGLAKLSAGMWLYDGLSLFRSHRLHRTLRRKATLEAEPALEADGLVGAPLYWDAATDDARLTLETALDAASHGATIVPWCAAVGWLRDDGGRVTGAVVRDHVGADEGRIRARAVVNCTGPWTDATLSLAGRPRPPMLRRTKGVHLVVDAARLPVRHAVVMEHPEDRRVLFAIPWGDRAYVGTTDTDFDGDPNEVAASREDVDYLLEAVNRYFPTHALGPEDVVSTWAGVRPLVAPPEGDAIDESSVSREHTIQAGHDGVITVAGGKLTTYRRMADEIVDAALAGLGADHRALSPARTGKDPLPGAADLQAGDAAGQIAQVAALGGLPEPVARALVGSYGGRAEGVAGLCAEAPALAAPLVPGRPEILAQVDWAVREELASRLSDVFVRRTQLFFRDRAQGLDAAERVADRMAALLGWDAARRNAELTEYRAEVALSRRWQEG